MSYHVAVRDKAEPSPHNPLSPHVGVLIVIMSFVCVWLHWGGIPARAPVVRGGHCTGSATADVAVFGDALPLAPSQTLNLMIQHARARRGGF